MYIYVYAGRKKSLCLCVCVLVNLGSSQAPKYFTAEHYANAIEDAHTRTDFRVTVRGYDSVKRSAAITTHECIELYLISV